MDCAVGRQWDFWDFGGVSLLVGAGASRVLAMVAALLTVPFIPVGTMLGTYTLALFVPRE
jgi:hypothetical protein